MAVFSNLHHLSEVLAHRIARSVEEAGESPLPAGTVQPGPPLENATIPGDAIRVTLLFVTPNPQARNATWNRGPDGRIAPPPLTLSATVLVTCYGSNGQEDPVRAQQLLGHVLQGFYSSPLLTLPLPDLPGCGEGALEIVQEALDLERVERVLSPLQIRHRPFALYEVGPIQLQHLAPSVAAPPLVLPGGPRLIGPSQQARVSFSGLLPIVSASGGVIRLMGSWGSLPEVRVGGQLLTPVAAGDGLLCTLPTLAPGSYPVELVAGLARSESRSLRIDPTVPSLDAPATATASPLLLSGRNLGMLSHLVLWPETGVRAPSDLRNLPIVQGTGGILLDLSGIPTGVYRLSGAWNFGGRTEYTPYLRLEVQV